MVVLIHPRLDHWFECARATVIPTLNSLEDDGHKGGTSISFHFIMFVYSCYVVAFLPSVLTSVVNFSCLIVLWRIFNF